MQKQILQFTVYSCLSWWTIQVQAITDILRAVMRIRDVYPGSLIRLIPSRIPDLGSKRFRILDPGSGSTSTSKISSIFNPNNLFLSSRKYDLFDFYPSRIQRSKRYRIPDPDPQHCLQDTTKWTPSRKIHARKADASRPIHQLFSRYNWRCFIIFFLLTDLGCCVGTQKESAS